MKTKYSGNLLHSTQDTFRKFNNINIFSIKATALILYIVFFLITFSGIADNYQILFVTLLTTSLTIWFGVIELIDPRSNRKIYDPSTLMNLALFYYCIKGLPMAWNQTASLWNFLPFGEIVSSYTSVNIYLILGIFTWNFTYRLVTQTTKNISDFETKVPLKISIPGVVIGILIGLFAQFLFFRSINQNIFVFIVNPHSRGYLGTSEFNVGSSVAYIFFTLIYMLAIASMLWLSYFKRNQIPNITWVLFVGYCLFMFALLFPRASLLGYLISVLFLFHRFIRPVPSFLIIIIGIISLIYSYLTTIWRSVVGSMSTFVAENATSELLYNVNIEGFMNFFSGMALSDIRIFVLIERFYGSLLPLKYGETLLRLITQLIPRAIWNDKPLDLGIEIGQLFLPGTLSGTPPGFFGEMYMNFHVFGVVFGAFILALILGKLYKIWILENNTRKGELYYAVLISRIALFPSSTIANIVLTLLIHFILMWGIVKISEKRIG